MTVIPLLITLLAGAGQSQLTGLDPEIFHALVPEVTSSLERLVQDDFKYTNATVYALERAYRECSDMVGERLFGPCLGCISQKCQQRRERDCGELDRTMSVPMDQEALGCTVSPGACVIIAEDQQAVELLDTTEEIFRSAAGYLVQDAVDQVVRDPLRTANPGNKRLFKRFIRIRLPRIRLPRIRLPRIRLPRIRIPRIRLPRIRIPRIRLPRIRIPRIRLPRIRLPRIRLPRIRIPRIRFPRIRIPRIRFPRIRIPRIRFPRIRIPRIRFPRIRIPRIRFPRIRIPRIPRKGIPKYKSPPKRKPGNRSPPKRKPPKRKPKYRSPPKRKPWNRSPPKRKPGNRSPPKRKPKYRSPPKRKPQYRRPPKRKPKYRSPPKRKPQYASSRKRKTDTRKPLKKYRKSNSRRRRTREASTPTCEDIRAHPATACQVYASGCQSCAGLTSLDEQQLMAGMCGVEFEEILKSLKSQEVRLARLEQIYRLSDPVIFNITAIEYDPSKSNESASTYSGVQVEYTLLGQPSTLVLKQPVTPDDPLSAMSVMTQLIYDELYTFTET